MVCFDELQPELMELVDELSDRSWRELSSQELLLRVLGQHLLSTAYPSQKDRRHG